MKYNYLLTPDLRRLHDAMQAKTTTYIRYCHYCYYPVDPDKERYHIWTYGHILCHECGTCDVKRRTLINDDVYDHVIQEGQTMLQDHE